MTSARSGKGDRRADSQFARARERRIARLVQSLSKRPSRVQVIVKAVNDNTLTVAFLEGNPTDGRTEDGNEFNVARPSDHRREVYDGQTDGDGWLHTYVSATQKTVTKGGETDETQKIMQAYQVDVTIITIDRVTSRGGLVNDGSLLLEWEDANTSGRAWGIVP